jgi:hypothetical protein
MMMKMSGTCITRGVTSQYRARSALNPTADIFVTCQYEFKVSEYIAYQIRMAS